MPGSTGQRPIPAGSPLPPQIPRTRCTKDRAAHLAFCIHAPSCGQSEAMESQRRRRSGRRGNSAGYHASPINRVAGQVLLPPRNTCLLASLRTRNRRRAPCASSSRRSTAPPEQKPEQRRHLRWETALPPSPTDSPVSSPYLAMNVRVHRCAMNADANLH